jgi:hypothetical protein
VKVNLINIAEYDLNEAKNGKVPFGSFTELMGYDQGKEPDGVNMPSARLFKTKEEFLSLSKVELQELDETKDVNVLSNGQFVVFLKSS